MPSYQEFVANIRKLISQGVHVDQAIQDVCNGYSDLVSDKNELLKMKQKIDRDLRG
jgi:uncharacterized protein YoaH (UPF0181 family)